MDVVVLEEPLEPSGRETRATLRQELPGGAGRENFTMARYVGICTLIIVRKGQGVARRIINSQIN